jgi:uncharacterized membrane-anchored protein YitT (DUF2179 family)
MFIFLGIVLYDIGFYFFLSPAKIVTGGMSGLAIILEPYLQQIGSWFTTSIFLYIVNGICLILGLIFIGKDFFLKTVYATLLQPTVLLIFELTMNSNYFVDSIANNVELICLLCGSILAGVGIGLAIKFNGSTGGMDVIQKIISKYFNVPISVAMHVSDGVVVFISGFVFNPFAFKIEKVVYGLIGVFAIAYIIDFIALSLKPRRTMYVITKKPNEIKELIYKEINRGVTFSSVYGAYSGEELTMVICTMDKNEAYRMTSKVVDIDKEAFTFVTSCKEVKGDYTKRGII